MTSAIPRPECKVLGRRVLGYGLAVVVFAVPGAAHDETVPPGSPCRIEACVVVELPEIGGADGRRAKGGWSPGGLSDLAVSADGSGRLWTTTDRGPNGTVDVEGKKLRTLLEPAFVPRIYEIALPTGNKDRVVGIGRTIPLTSRSGQPLSGRPNGIGRDEPVLDAAGQAPLSHDPDGVDTEGIVQMPDGTFWMVEEYRPSLLHVSPTGQVLRRFVPEGTRLDGADMEIRGVLPAVYGARRDNRGFESIAVSPDGRRLWVMLQSPLDNGSPKKVGKAGNVRLMVFDPVAGRPLAEHVYRLGDPAVPYYLTRGAAPADGKLCAMAAIDAESLLVIEQDDTGLARLYHVDLATATDTLGRQSAADETTLEEIRDLEAAGIRPLQKTLVADLGALVSAMRRDVYGDREGRETDPLKLEGLAILGPDRIAIVNDNDFGVHVKREHRCHTCLWVIRLGEPPPGVHRRPSTHLHTLDAPLR